MYSPVIAETMLTGSGALILWGFIWLRAIRRPLGSIGPTSLFALGLLVLYIIPSLYWQFRPWNYVYPPFFDGLPLVMCGAIVLGIPFLFNSLRGQQVQKMQPWKMQRVHENYGVMLWLALIPVLAGIAFRIYQFSLGVQGRNEREAASLFGSEELGFIVSNLSFYFPIFYYLLILFGNRLQRRFGKIFWIVDGMMQLMTFHRWPILVFILRSIIFLTILGWKFTRRRIILIVFACAFTISIIGSAGLITRERTAIQGISYLGPLDFVSVMIEASEYYFTGDSTEKLNILFLLIDDTMERIYMARSASAVMMGTPDIIPYFYGATFVHILYAWVPRYFWSGKPYAGETNLLTKLVMPDVSGLEPMGTIAELYVNYGFIMIFLGGVLCLMICRWQEQALLRGRGTSQIWLSIYPIMSIWFFWADALLSQRISEGLRMLLVYGIVWFLLRMIRKGFSTKRLIAIMIAGGTPSLRKS